MNSSYEDFKNTVAGKRIALLGYGVSNADALPFLLSCGAFVTVRDVKKEPDRKVPYSPFVTCLTGEDYLKDLTEEVILRSPGLRPDTPELADAVKRGCVLTSEIELFCDLCPCPIYAVTGSDGKTTTTTLIYKMLSQERQGSGSSVYLGGNIGTPLLSIIPEIKEDDAVVLELSSFQLFTMSHFHPHVSVVTNLSPNHLNWHTDMDEYIDAKRHISREQKSGRLVINDKNEISRTFSSKGAVTVRFSSDKKPAFPCVYLKENDIVYADETGEKKVLSRSDIVLRGLHNVENYMAAVGAVYGEISALTIQKVARSFSGVPHRLELVEKKDGVSYYNSSIDSSPTRSIAALSVFDEPVGLICGGYDKHIPLDPLIPVIIKKARFVCATGQTGKEIEAKLKKAGYGNVRYYECFDGAVLSACNTAKSGEVVLLSPAAASFDMFRNFEERGERFRSLVKKITRTPCGDDK